MELRKLSIVIPVYNEEGNIKILLEEINVTCSRMVQKKEIESYEVIFVNDGSTDKTQLVLESFLNKRKGEVRIIEFRKNFGQTAALKAGFSIAKGDIIVTMDGDLQNDPGEIPILLKKLDEGYDVVSGWRHDRRDALSKKVFSKIINALRRKMIGDELHDYGCSLKIYKKECIKDLQLFGELHRYITAYLFIKGYKIGEVKVNHRQRHAGITKYRFNRGINGLLDLFYLKFWSSFSDRPLHFFGRLGIYQWLLAAFICIEQIIKALIVKELTLGPLLALASLLVMTGLSFIIFGFLYEIMARTYFKDENTYSIKSIK